MENTYRTKTRCYRVDAEQPDPSVIALAGEMLRNGRLVAFPTETVYGLGANALDTKAVAAIFGAKGRPASDPLIVHIGAIDTLSQVAMQIPDLAIELMRRFTPGPLTLVLKKRAEIPRVLTAGLDTVAVRIPDHAVALALIDAAGAPVAAPSANRFSRPSPTCAQHVLDDLDGRVDVILDGGDTPLGMESTIVDLTGDEPTVLRPGGISLEALGTIAPEITFQPRYMAEDAQAAPAPGSQLRHYSPRARVLLFRAESDDDALAAMRAEIANGCKTGVLAMDAELPDFAGLAVELTRLGADLNEAASRLFTGLRALDDRGVEQILVKWPEPSGMGLAIGDRLLRAAAGRIIEVPGRG